MNHTMVTTISDEISNEVAASILTRQRELKRDPKELLDIVLTVHDTLRHLSEKLGMRAARESTAHSGRRRELVTPILTDLQTANEKPMALVVDDSTDIAIMLVMILQHPATMR